MNAATENEMHDGGGTTRPPRGKLVVVALVVAALLGVGLWLSYRPVPGQLQGMVDAREIRVTLKPDRLLALGITAADVNRQLRLTSADMAGGRAEVGGQEQSIRALAASASLETLAATSIVLPGKTLRVEFDADNPGRWLTHCHNVYHGEAGMMTTIAYQEN